MLKNSLLACTIEHGSSQWRRLLANSGRRETSSSGIDRWRRKAWETDGRNRKLLCVSFAQLRNSPAYFNPRNAIVIRYVTSSRLVRFCILSPSLCCRLEFSCCSLVQHSVLEWLAPFPFAVAWSHDLSVFVATGRLLETRLTRDFMTNFFSSLMIKRVTKKRSLQNFLLRCCAMFNVCYIDNYHCLIRLEPYPDLSPFGSCFTVFNFNFYSSF